MVFYLLQIGISKPSKYRIEARTINFAVFEEFTTNSKMNSSKSYYSIESYDSLVDPQNLIHEMYCGEIPSKTFRLENYLLYGKLKVDN